MCDVNKQLRSSYSKFVLRACLWRVGGLFISCWYFLWLVGGLFVVCLWRVMWFVFGVLVVCL